MLRPAFILTCALVGLARGDLDDIQRLNELQNGGGKEDTTYKSSGMGKILRHYLESNDIRLGDGVHIVKMEGSAPRADDDSFLGTVDGYLQTHEVKIRLADFMPDQLGQNKAAIDSTEETGGIGTARKKGGKGGGYGAMIIMGLMMAKMMGAMGLGGVGLMTMKAMMVSAMALMLSMVMGVKKLAYGGGGDNGHTVIHATSSHGGGGGGYDKRRRRDAEDLAYSGWNYYKPL